MYSNVFEYSGMYSLVKVTYKVILILIPTERERENLFKNSNIMHRKKNCGTTPLNAQKFAATNKYLWIF